MISRSATASGAYLLRRAKQLAERITVKFGRRYEVIDGYLLDGRRINKQRVASVMDVPAQLAVLGYYRSPPFGSALHPGRSLVLELAAGRDSYLPGGVQGLVPPAIDQLLYSGDLEPLLIGLAPSSLFRYAVSGEKGQPMPGYGALRGFTYVANRDLVPQNQLAYVTRDLPVLYVLNLTAPALSSVRIARDKPDDQQYSPNPPFRAYQSLLISDSVMQQTFGAMAMAKPVGYPEYQNVFYESAQHIAQAPWHSFTEPRPTETGYRVWVVAHAVFDMVSDEDRFGARGLWIALVDVHYSEEEGVNIADILTQLAIDSRDNSGFAAPQKSESSGLYRYNAHLRVAPCVLSDGSMVIADPHQCADGADQNRYYSLDIYWISQGSVQRQELLTAVNMGETGRMSAPIGMDVDDSNAVVLVAFSAAYTLQTELTVVLIAGGVAEIMLQGLHPMAPCLSGFADSKYSAGFVPENIDPGGVGNYKTGWGYLGAGGNQVRYIGRGKWAFYVSSVQGAVGGVATANWAMAIYDSAANAAQVVGVINPDLVAQNRFDLGAIECIRAETDSRKATLIATRGGNAQYVGHGDVSTGQTYISYDSGATWAAIAEVGSPAGAFHCGNALQARAQPITRI